jgi:Family of unknown function (DUF5761)
MDPAVLTSLDYSHLRSREDFMQEHSQAPSSANGRVTFLPGENGSPFYMFTDGGRGVRDTASTDVFRDIELNPTSSLFFSPHNIDALQEGIRYQVYVRSGAQHVIGRQSETELVAIMRAMYLQHGKNTTCGGGTCHDLSEVRRLNSIVIDYCLQRILPEVDIYMRYRSDITRLPTPMERGAYSSSKGTKTLVHHEF